MKREARQGVVMAGQLGKKKKTYTHNGKWRNEGRKEEKGGKKEASREGEGDEGMRNIYKALQRTLR